MTENWPTKRLAVASLHLDAKNPRLGRETLNRAPRELVQYLFEHDKAFSVAKRIADHGFFPNEALLAYKDGDSYIVVEGNRRLAAVKALREPGLLEGSMQRKVERLSRSIGDLKTLARVPVTIAPNRRATDGLLVARHMGTPVLPWEAENRASFILEKLEEGYTNKTLCDELFFTPADIQEARQTRAIADMARSVDLPEEVKAKLDNPRAKVFSTLGRVFDSAVGREFLQVEPSADHGIQGKTTKAEFVRVFTRLVSDVALGKQDSRTLNTGDNIRDYFRSWPVAERPTKKRGSFVPSAIIKGKSTASPKKTKPDPKPTRARKESKTVLPKNLKVRFGTTRLSDIHRELTRLKRAEYPNAGAVLLRVFLELTALHYLQRTGELDKLIQTLGGKKSLAFGTPTMKQIAPSLIKAAEAKLSKAQANMVKKALKYDRAAPFTVTDLHAFVHQEADMPGERDILQFWLRTEPLFRLMLEEDPGGAAK
jgi:hypothetical protein